MRNRIVVFSVLVVLVSTTVFGQQQASTKKAIEELNLEDLLNVSVVSASKTAERVADAPATVIVVNREDIRQRGYTEMSQILDDLPGMQVVRPYGDTYFKDYWRGYRNTIGEPFLVMVDGMVFNHLYYNTGDILATFPLSNVDHIEVVYGPASSVYGANAFMGVINIITVKDAAADGATERGSLTAASFDTRIADMNVFYKTGDFRFSVTGRIDNGNVDHAAGQRYEYTKDKYYADPGLYGGFVDNPNIAGRYSSPHQNRAFDIRAFLRSWEFGMQYYQLSSGYGGEFAADQSQSLAVWDRPDLALYARTQHEFSPKATGTTLVRYRRSDLKNDSTFLESYDSTDASGKTVRVNDYSYWQSLNSSVALFQDFDIKANDRFSMTTGFKYEQKDLQKAYDINYGPAIPSSQLNGSTYPYPLPPTSSNMAQNRITTEDHGVYVQSKYRFLPQQVANLGLRYDHNSKYGSATTVRAGYVGSFGRLGVKALAGNAFQEPAPRLLYGGWTGSGSDPNLKPEKSRTAELSATWTASWLSHLVSIWDVQNRDTIINTTSGAQNLGKRHVSGLDYHAQALLHVPRLDNQLRLWGYYSHIFKESERRHDAAGNDIGSGRIGDLAHDQIMAGVTAGFASHVTTTLRGRWVSHRDTVASNPVGTVGSYTTFDLTGRYDDLFARGLGVGLTIGNLLNEHYYEPGVRGASSGTTPGYWDANGQWHGSIGFYNSLLPQPGRSVAVTMNFAF